ncbi:hypothetical protein RhiJN_18547 [Ceratobasidium sp. AG-Ba]|nr:hypothetical protein RhiJN_18547 [Ceratobasidium sp. AG-Ba]
MSTGSVESKFYAASEICKIGEKFEDWAYEVSAVFPPRRQIPIGEVEKLVRQTDYLPKWLYNKNADEYKPLAKLYHVGMSELFKRIREPIDGHQEPLDDSLSDSLAHALQHILHIYQRHNQLTTRPVVPYNESDLRQPLDRNMMCWSLEWNQKTIAFLRSERTLQLLRTQAVPIPDSTVDSVIRVFDARFDIEMEKFDELYRGGLTCAVKSFGPLELVHWVIEHNASNHDHVQRQVYYGMVSSLWQRRALGRMKDFVFGMAHADVDIRIYAARWEKKSTAKAEAVASATQGDSSELAQDQTPGTTIPPKGPKSQDANAETGSNKSLAPDRQKALKQEEMEYEIIVYDIARYTTQNPFQMIKLYLLMRASRKLAEDYINDLCQDSTEGIQRRVEALERYNWPSPPRQRAKSQLDIYSILEDSLSSASRGR